MAEDLQLEFTVSDKIKAIQTSNSKILKILSQKHCVILCEEFISDRFSHTGTCSVKTALEPQPGYECPGTKVCSKPCTLHRCHSFIPSGPTPSLYLYGSLPTSAALTSMCIGQTDRVYSLYSAVLHLPQSQKALASEWGRKRTEILTRYINSKSALK